MKACLSRFGGAVRLRKIPHTLDPIVEAPCFRDEGLCATAAEGYLSFPKALDETVPRQSLSPGTLCTQYAAQR